MAKHTLRGSEMAVVTVTPSDSPPVRYRGRIWIRTGPRRSLASAQDERILNEKRRHRDRVAHNRTAVDFTSGPREKRRSQYPLSALQQLTRNALLHRVYEGTHAPARVYWYDDRIEILSPGGPFGEVNAANFGTPGLADYRNPNLAEALRVLGLVQRYGFGIALARRELEQNGNPPPVFAVQASHVLVTLRPAS